MFWLIIILLIITVYAFFFLAQFYNIILNRVPFIATNKEIIGKIISELEISEQAIVYELGCGQALFLRLFEKNFPKAKLTGIENLFLVCLFDKIKFKLLGSKIKILNGDLFKLDFKDADLIYCYLGGMIMKKLEDKLRQECKKGTQIVSCVFTLPNFTPKKVMTVSNKKIYFYEI